jgi:NAD(P)-dependent dehydrogenase (short-subunit alcohol dehydrogenase family)
MDRSSKVVVVTGASAGIGRATVRRFARDGASIALLARGRDGLEAAAREVEALGGRALVLPTDVSDAAAVEQAAAAAEAAFGPIDIWINNAFAGIFSTFMDMSEEEYRRVTDVTYFGQVHGTRAALKRMLPRDRGAIVLVGSALAYRGIPLQSAYCGAKHAIQGFLDSVRCELLHDRSKVRLTMVQLPGVNTPQFDWVRAHVPGRPRPTGTVYQPEVAADAIHFAAHASRKQLIVGMPALEAIWGDKIASPLLDLYLGRTAFAGQQSSEPVSPDRRDNLFDPVPGDHGAHGRFDAQAKRSSVQLWATKNRAGLALAAGAAAGAAFMFGRARKDKAKGGNREPSPADGI